jgi:hypothetical protein
MEESEVTANRSENRAKQINDESCHVQALHIFAVYSYTSLKLL